MDNNEIKPRLVSVETRLEGVEKGLEELKEESARNFNLLSRAMLHTSNEIKTTREDLLARIEHNRKESKNEFEHVYVQIEKVEAKVDSLQYSFDEFVKNLPGIVAGAVQPLLKNKDA